MTHTKNMLTITMKINTAITITVISMSPALAGAKNVSGLDLGSGRFWEQLLQMFG